MAHLPRVLQNKHLQHAAAHGNVAAIKLAIKLGADVNAKGKDGWTPLMHAYSICNEEAIEILKLHGAKMTIEEKMNAQIGADLHKICTTHISAPHRRIGARN